MSETSFGRFAMSASRPELKVSYWRDADIPNTPIRELDWTPSSLESLVTDRRGSLDPLHEKLCNLRLKPLCQLLDHGDGGIAHPALQA